MGWRFRKVINFGGLFRLNLSKGGIGWSVGAKGIRYGESPTGQKHISAGIPKTGVYWYQVLGKKQRRQQQTIIAPALPTPSTQQAKLPATPVNPNPKMGFFHWLRQKINTPPASIPTNPNKPPNLPNNQKPWWKQDEI